MARIKIKIDLTTIDGDIIPTSAIDFTKFNEKPNLLLNHQLNELPLGEVSEIKKSGNGFMFKPIFHKLTKQSRMLDFFHKERKILNAYPGGYVERDENGNITKFTLYEVSICPPF